MRIQKLQEQLKSTEISALYISDTVDLFYLTGLELSTGALVVTENNASLFVDGRYQEVAETIDIPSFNIKELTLYLKDKKVGFDGNRETYLFVQSMIDQGIDMVAYPSLVKENRMVKEKNEIDKISNSAKVLAEAFFYLVDQVKEGITELELAFCFHRFLLDHKISSSFSPIVAFGENSAKPHHYPSNRKLKKDELILLDLGVVVDYYHSDATRVFFFGQPDSKIEQIYQIVNEAKNKAIEQLAVGMTTKQIDQVARDLIGHYGYKDYFIHSLGHGIGLETHEMPFLRETNPRPLVEKSIVTIEPGIYFANEFGIRIEDMLLIDKNCTNLTQFFVSECILKI